jgi:predicted nucleotidyltransferase component of viral defense system
MSDLVRLWQRFADDPVLLAEHVQYTARQTGFRPELVEKDYHCSVVLHALAQAGQEVVFKGGTCLSKAYGSFYRLSEDLDFVLPVPVDCPRARRREVIAPVKKLYATLPRLCPGLDIEAALRGANESTQYLGALAYQSLISNRRENIKLEFGLREPLLLHAENRQLATLLMNSITGEAAVPRFGVRVMSLTEALAEKTRAALTRREPAIRDFFDLDFAVQQLDLALGDDAFLGHVRAKLAVPGNDPVDVSPARRARLTQQVESRLKPVLRPVDFDGFDLDRIFAMLVDLAATLEDRARSR